MKLTKKIKAYFLRRLTQKNFSEFQIKDSKNILFLRYDRIGDMIITTPVFRELKHIYPNVNVIVLASKANKDVLQNNPYVDEIFVCKKNHIFKDFFLLIKLRKKQIDVCIEFDHSVIPHAILRIKAINPKKVISVSKEGRYGVKGHELELYDIYIDNIQNKHFCDIWLKTLEPFEIEPRSNHYDLFITINQEKFAKKYLSKYLNKKIIGINIEGAIKEKKIHFTQLKKILEGLFNANNNIQIIILSSPNRYKYIKGQVSGFGLKHVASSYLTETILDAAALIKQMDLVISPDTSIVHIASAFNIPTISIHENNLKSHTLFAPKSDHSITVFSKFSDKLEGYNVGKIIQNSIELLEKNES